jgi:hypothetical protein
MYGYNNNNNNNNLFKFHFKILQKIYNINKNM